MIKTLKHLLLILLITTLTCVAYASNANYTAQVPVANNSQAQWQQGVQQALQQVLINVTNNPDVGNVAGVKNALPKAGDMVQSFSYSTVKQNNQSQLMLDVNFDSKSVEQLINGLGQKAWQKQAAQGLLVWLVVGENNNEQFIGSDSKNNYATLLQTAAHQKNLTLTLPVVDLADLNALSTNDVATLEPDPIIQASTRYQTQNILAGYVSQTPGGNSWQGGWWLLYNGKSTQFQTVGDSPAQVINRGMNKVATNIAPSDNTNASNTHQINKSSTTTNDNNTEQVILKITNVSGLSDYAEVMKYLRSLLSVTQVDIDNVQGQDLILKITTSEQSLLLSQLAQSQKLIADPSATGGPGLTYRWAGILPIDPSPATSINTPPSAQSVTPAADNPTNNDIDTGVMP